MKKLYILLFSVLFTLPALRSTATVWTVTNNGFSFSPGTITISLGDTVLFSIASMHNVVEVSQATWNANGNTSNGGFTLPFGGGTFVPTQAQTYYYVCQPHAGGGMKGQIIVNNSTGINVPLAADGALRFNPNPANNQTVVHTGLADNTPVSLKVFDLAGKIVFRKEKVLNNYVMDLSSLNNGIYFVEIRSDEYVRTGKLILEN